MAFDKNTPYNDLPLLPPAAAIETPEILKYLTKVSRHLGELNGLCASLSEPAILINTIALQESKDSSAIENIVTTQDELYQATMESEPATHSAKEVLSYRSALYTGWDSMQARHNILSINTMAEIVQAIKQNNSAIRNTPGTALKNAVTGDVIYTPPEGEEIIREKLSNLERFINDDEYSSFDPLVKMAIIHYQFEAIHPFIDGNGRTGRILNGLYLVQQGLLPQPVLYMSSYIVKNKTLYYQLLKGVTENNNWHDWIMYNLTAIMETSQITTSKIRMVLELKASLEKALKETLGSSYNYDLLRLMFEHPYLKIEILEKRGLAHRQTASAWLKKLVDNKVMTVQKKGKTMYFINYRLMDILVN
jgi:cell filamentation protein, protein adenylyltransferase